MSISNNSAPITNITHLQQRIDLAAAFQTAAKLNLHEAVANHFSLAVNDDGTEFLINPNQRHFSLIKSSDILLLDANDPDTMNRPDAPDPTAWGLHGGVHRHVPHARCIMHVHSPFATALSCLEDCSLPPIDQTSAMFYERCARLFSSSKVKILIMGNHGLLVLGDSVADTFNRLYYFERAAMTYIRALQTGKKIRTLSHEIAEKTARELEQYEGQADKHFDDLKLILDRDGSDYRS